MNNATSATAPPGTVLKAQHCIPDARHGATPYLRQLRQRGIHVICEGQALPTGDALHDVVKVVPPLPIVLLEGPGLGCSKNGRTVLSCCPKRCATHPPVRAASDTAHRMASQPCQVQHASGGRSVSTQGNDVGYKILSDLLAWNALTQAGQLVQCHTTPEHSVSHRLP